MKKPWALEKVLQFIIWITPRNPTYIPKMAIFKGNHLFQTTLLGIHVSFRWYILGMWLLNFQEGNMDPWDFGDFHWVSTIRFDFPLRVEVVYQIFVIPCDTYGFVRIVFPFTKKFITINSHLLRNIFMNMFETF